MTEQELHKELEMSLATSSGAERSAWAQILIENNLPLRSFFDLLQTDIKTATRFQWFLSDVGMADATILFNELSHLLQLSYQIDHFEFQPALASYWRIAGVPEKDEAVAFELLLMWMQSKEVSATIKSRALEVLEELHKKYPDLDNEIILCLDEQISTYEGSLRKKTLKILKSIRKD